MKNGKLMIESLAGICITIIGYLYFQGRMESYYDLMGTDLTLPMTILPFLFFMPAYIAGRWIFHYVVYSAHEKAIRALFIIQVIILCMYLAVGIFYMLMKSTGLWPMNGFMQAGYAYFIMFGSSKIGSAIFVFLGVLFAFTMSIKYRSVP